MTAALDRTFTENDFGDFEPSARWILVVASAEARMARHPVVSSAHIVLANWLAVNTPAAQALREAGMSGRIAKAWINHEIRPDSRSGNPHFDPAFLARVREIAAERGARRVAAQHLLEAATESHELDGVSMIRAQGISHERLHRLIESVLSMPPAPAVMERFTDTTRAMIVRAGAYARELSYPEVGPGHVLLGILETPSEARTALQHQRISLEAARVAFEEIIGRGDEGPKDHVPFSQEMQAVLDHAAELATGLIAPHHVLAALIDHAIGDDQDVVRALGADPAAIRDQLIQPGSPTSEPAAMTPTPRPANIMALRPFRRQPTRPSRGWRPELLLVALGFLSLVGPDNPNLWSRLGYGGAAAGAVAVGAGAFLRAWVRRGPWRFIRMITAGALTLMAAALLLGRIFA